MYLSNPDLPLPGVNILLQPLALDPGLQVLTDARDRIICHLVAQALVQIFCLETSLETQKKSRMCFIEWLQHGSVGPLMNRTTKVIKLKAVANKPLPPVGARSPVFAAIPSFSLSLCTAPCAQMSNCAVSPVPTWTFLKVYLPSCWEAHFLSFSPTHFCSVTLCTVSTRCTSRLSARSSSRDFSLLCSPQSRKIS